MKHTVYIYKESSDCNARPVLYPCIASESTKRFCRKFSRNNVARVGEVTCITNVIITWRNKLVCKIGKSSISFNLLFAVCKELL